MSEHAHAERLAAVLEVLVPGAAAVGAEEYVVLVAPSRPGASEAVEALLAATRNRPDVTAAVAELEGGDAFETVRGLACEAFYGDWVAPRRAGPGGWAVCGFAPGRTLALAKDWSFLRQPGAR